MTRDEAYLRHIRDAIQRILEYTHDGRDVFYRSKLIQDAVIRNLEIIGEATRALSPALREQHPHIPWANMAGMRNVLIHDYMGVDLDIVWDVVENRLKGLCDGIEAILRDFPSP